MGVIISEEILPFDIEKPIIVKRTLKSYCTCIILFDTLVKSLTLKTYLSSGPFECSTIGLLSSSFLRLILLWKDVQFKYGQSYNASENDFLSCYYVKDFNIKVNVYFINIWDKI